MRHILLATSVVLFPQLASAGQCQVPPPLEPSTPPVKIVATSEGTTIPRLLKVEEINQSPALRRIASNGATIWEIGDTMSNHGLRGVFARNGQNFRTFYLTPDLQAEVGGVMWDAQGHNITRDTVSMIPGVIPTVKWDAGHTNQPKIASGQTPGEVTHVDGAKVMASASFGLYGHAGTPRLYMIVDPLCPWSIRALQSLQPYVDNGKLELAIVPIAINDYENNHTSTPAAQAMLSVGQRQMVDVWREIIALNHAPEDVSLTETSGASLQLNLQKAHMVGLRGTPTIVWLDKSGVSHTQSGLPDNVDALISGLAR